MSATANSGIVMDPNIAQTISLYIAKDVPPEQLALKLNWPMALGCMRSSAGWPVLVIQTVAQLPNRNIPCCCGVAGCWLIKYGDKP